MNIRRISILVSIALAIFSCGKLRSGGGDGTPQPQVPGESNAPYVGHWLSDCTNMGSGNINRVYMEIGTDLKVAMAVLTYDSSNCTGSYELGDGNGNTVTEAQLTQQLSEENVEDIPSNFYVLKFTSLTTSGTSYSIIYINDTEFYQLFSFNNPHDTWNQWQGEADVSQFAMNPTTYNPLVYDKMHFVKSELP